MLLGQNEGSDGRLRQEIAGIRSHNAEALTQKRMLVFCDALRLDAGAIIAADYAARAARQVH